MRIRDERRKRIIVSVEHCEKNKPELERSERTLSEQRKDSLEVERRLYHDRA
jgi:hypothetical protein